VNAPKRFVSARARMRGGVDESAMNGECIGSTRGRPVRTLARGGPARRTRGGPARRTRGSSTATSGARRR